MKKQILKIYNSLQIKSMMLYYSMVWIYLVIKFVLISCILNGLDTEKITHDLHLYRRRVAYRMKTTGLPIRPEAESLLFKKR